MPPLKHIHSYIRFRKKISTDPGTGKRRTEWFFKCEDPRCTSWSTGDLIEGKLSLCPNCRKNEFPITRADLRKKRPVCLECSNSSEAQAVREVRTHVDDILSHAGILENIEKKEP